MSGAGGVGGGRGGGGESPGLRPGFWGSMGCMTTKTHPLAAHVGTRKNVQIDRDLEGDPSVSGYVIAMGDELALVHTFDDFEPDGYMLIRLDVGERGA